MIAKQTAVSASLVVLVGGSFVTAHADPDEASSVAAGEVQPAPSPEPCATAAPGCAPAPLVTVETPVPRRPTGRFQVGAGYDPDDGFVFGATVAQDRLFGTPTQLSLSSLLSARRQLFDLRLAHPGLFGTRLGIQADVYSGRRVFTGFSRAATGGAISLVHPLGEHVQAFVGYRLEHVEVEADHDALARTVLGGAGGAFPGGDGVISALRAGVTYSTLDSPILPMRGTSAGATIEVADHRLGSDVDLTRVNAWVNHHRGLGPFTLHLGGSISTVTSGDPLGVPISERLQLDGSGDVRGFAPGALGPTDRISGMPLGGNVKALARGELELPIAYGVSVAGFADAGTVVDRDGHGGLGYSVGVSVIWRSPIGPLRFDWAIPFSDDGKRGETRFLFSLGSSF